MTATTSNTTEFTLDVDEIIEEALDNVGGDYTDGNEQQKARRTLNLLLIELQNKNIPLNKLDYVSTALLEDVSEYTLPPSVSDILKTQIKMVSTGISTTLGREGVKEFHQISNITQSGRPTVFVTERGVSAVNVKVWPVPEATGKYTLESLVVKRIEDINASYQKIDLPYRYYPLIVIWLSYKLSLKRDSIDENKKQRLKNEYLEIMQDVFEEDRERSDWTIVPGGISGR